MGFGRFRCSVGKPMRRLLRWLVGDPFDDGLDALMKGEYEKAIERFTRALDEDPGRREALLYRGIAYLESGRAGEAVQDLTRYLERERTVEGYYHRAMAWMELRKLDRAEEDLSAALRLDPEDAEVWTVRGVVRALQERYAEALEDVDRAIELGHPDGWRNRAVVLERMGRLEEALQSWDRAVEARPEDPEIWARRGLLRLRLQRVEEGRRDLERAWRGRGKLNPELQNQVREALDRVQAASGGRHS